MGARTRRGRRIFSTFGSDSAGCNPPEVEQVDPKDFSYLNLSAAWHAIAPVFCEVQS
jgi:hypothetical protein